MSSIATGQSVTSCTNCVKCTADGLGSFDIHLHIQPKDFSACCSSLYLIAAIPPALAMDYALAKVHPLANVTECINRLDALSFNCLFAQALFRVRHKCTAELAFLHTGSKHLGQPHSQLSCL